MTNHAEPLRWHHQPAYIRGVGSLDDTTSTSPAHKSPGWSAWQVVPRDARWSNCDLRICSAAFKSRCIHQNRACSRCSRRHRQTASTCGACTWLWATALQRPCGRTEAGRQHCNTQMRSRFAHFMVDKMWLPRMLATQASGIMMMHLPCRCTSSRQAAPLLCMTSQRVTTAALWRAAWLARGVLATASR